MSERRWTAVSRVVRVGALVGVVMALTSGCIGGVFHLTNEAWIDVSDGRPCGTITPRADGIGFVGASGVTAPDIDVYAGVVEVGEEGEALGGLVWTEGHQVRSVVGPVVAGTHYALFASSPATPTVYATDVGVVLVVLDAEGNAVPVDCVEEA